MTERINPEQLTDEQQAFPRIMLFEFHDSVDESGQNVAQLELLGAWPNAFPDGPVELADGRRQGFSLPGSLGQSLTDNSVKEDGYRFHDALHIGVMAGLGWSPVMRKLLGVKRRGDPQIDEIDDGGRAKVLEESLFDFLGMREVEFGNSVEQDIDLTFASMAVKYALDERGTGADHFTRVELEHALLEGTKLFHEVKRNLGGLVLANLDNRTAMYIPKDPATYISPQQALIDAREKFRQQEDGPYEFHDSINDSAEPNDQLVLFNVLPGAVSDDFVRLEDRPVGDAIDEPWSPIQIQAPWPPVEGHSELYFGQQTLPLRELQVAGFVIMSGFKTTDWPPRRSADSKPITFAAAVAKSEKSDQSEDIKNARLLGMMAAISTVEFAVDLTLREWGLTPHLGMLDALGASLVVGLPVTEDAIYMASAYHIKAATGKRPPDPDQAYASVGSDSILQKMNRTAIHYAILAFRGGVDKFINYHTESLDVEFNGVPPGARILASYESAESPPPALNTYKSIQASVDATRTELVSRREDVDRMLTFRYGINRLNKRALKNR